MRHLMILVAFALMSLGMSSSVSAGDSCCCGDTCKCATCSCSCCK